jgi:hypothetical protein
MAKVQAIRLKNGSMIIQRRPALSMLVRCCSDQDLRMRRDIHGNKGLSCKVGIPSSVTSYSHSQNWYNSLPPCSTCNSVSDASFKYSDATRNSVSDAPCNYSDANCNYSDATCNSVIDAAAVECNISCSEAVAQKLSRRVLCQQMVD